MPEVDLVSERDGLKRRIREKSERLELQARGMELTMEGMAVLRGDTYLWMNAAHAGMYGWRAEDLTGLTWRALYTPDIQAWIERVAFPALTRNGRWHGEIVGLRKDGTPVDIELSLTMASDTLICCCRDISARKANERRLEESMRALDEMNGRLQNASRLKDEFLACMSHELRTPLHAMVGIAELLAEGLAGPTTPQQKQFLDRLMSSGRHLRDLIDDLLEVSKIESGQLALVREPVPLQYLVELALERVNPLAAESGVVLQYRTPTLLTMDLDERRMIQVLVNLLTNAVKVSERGARVTVSIEETDRAIVLAVADTGIGIAVSDHASLFEACRQVDSSLTRSKGGTGLGLYLVKRLTELHGGSVSVDSEPGHGSSFRIVLPRTLVLEPSSRTPGLSV